MSQSDQIYKNLIKNSSWLFAGKSASSVFSGLQEIIVARVLGLTQYGLLSLVIAYVDILNNFIDLRVWSICELNCKIVEILKKSKVAYSRGSLFIVIQKE